MRAFWIRIRDLATDAALLAKNQRRYPSLPYPVIDEVQVGYLSAMLLAIPQGVEFPENIFAVDRDERVVWQVEERRNSTTAHYTRIYLSVGGALTAVRADGIYRILDARTGRILKETREDASVKA